MLLVDDHQAQLGQWREYRATRTEHHSGLAVSHAPPLVRSLPASEPAVQDGDTIPEPSEELLSGCRR